MNKFYILCLFILSIFFLFSPNVSASTYNFTINQQEIDMYSHLNDMKTKIENYISQNSSTYSSDYIIAYINGLKNVYIIKSSVSNYQPIFNNNANIISLGGSTNSSSLLRFDNNYNLSLIGVNTGDSFIRDVISNTNYIIYSTKTINFNNTTNIYNITFIDKVYTQPTSNDMKFYTLDNIYNDYYSAPADNYPILTSFFSVFLDRLSFLADYITNSYIFLSIFVVFLFTFVFLLLRRLSQ